MSQKLMSNATMLRHLKRMRRDSRAMETLRAALSEKQRAKPQKPVSPVLSQPRDPQTPLDEPLPDRIKRGEVITKAQMPPFNSQILTTAQRFAKALGPEVMVILELLHETGMRGESYRGLTSRYEGVRIDSSRAGYEHMAASDRDAHERFQLAMSRLPAELRDMVRELVLEDTRRSVRAIGEELSGFTSEQRALGAVPAALRIIAWCVRDALYGRGRKRAVNPGQVP